MTFKLEEPPQTLATGVFLSSPPSSHLESQVAFTLDLHECAHLLQDHRMGRADVSCSRPHLSSVLSPARRTPLPPPPPKGLFFILADVDARDQEPGGSGKR